MNNPLLSKEHCDYIKVSVESDLATVTLDRVEKRNAFNLEMWKEINGAFTSLDENHDIKCIVIRGGDDKFFGVGADISEFEKDRKNSQSASAYGKVMHGAMHSIQSCCHPVIARISGLCIGGALELALMCDIRICSTSSKFGVPINKLGLVMAYPEIAALVRVVGPSTALEILYEGKILDAKEAKDKGLVNRVVEGSKLDQEISDLVISICEGAPLVNRWHKKFVYNLLGKGMQIDSLSNEELSEGFECYDTEDFNIGVNSFLNKTSPKFKGK